MQMSARAKREIRVLLVAGKTQIPRRFAPQNDTGQSGREKLG
jgi:hypothetical protein